MTDREAIKMAFDTLVNLTSVDEYGSKEEIIAKHKTMGMLRQALAQPEQEPVAWRKKVNGVWHYFDESTPFPCDDCEPLYEKH